MSKRVVFPPSVLRNAFVVFALALIASLFFSAAAEDAADVPPAPLEVTADDGSVSGTGSQQPLALASFGLNTGFPGYQRLAASVGIQYQFVGVQFKGGYTVAGPYLGFGLRGYPPLPLPVPVFAGIGGGFYGDSTSLELTIGAHVPVSEQFRINLEGGAARVSSFGEAQWLPFVSAGVSYVVAFNPAELAASRSESATPRASAGGRCFSEGPPSETMLVQAFEQTLSRFIRNAEATYAGTYSDLNYNYRITDVTMSDKAGTVTIDYSGSVRTIAGGATESAAGSASASFSWNGCSWRRTSLDY